MITKVAVILITTLLLVASVSTTTMTKEPSMAAAVVDGDMSNTNGDSSSFDDDDQREGPSTHVPHILSSAVTMDATIGESVTFPCDIDDLRDFVLLWRTGKNKVLFAVPVKVTRDDRFQIVGNTSLHISSVLPKDSGEYSCQISTTPATELTHVLNVLYPPSVKPRPESGEVTAKEGEDVTLSCDATGNPEPTISWKHAGRHYESKNGKNFVLNGVQKSDSGEYECIADNDVGDPASATISVDVVSAPKISPHPASGFVTVNEGEAVSISCEATGDPIPEITWNKPDADKVHSSENNTKITISEATRNHAGTYECIASNSMGISTSFEIKVKVSYAPEIEVDSEWMHAGEGTTVDLICIVHGEPHPSVTWKKGDEVLFSNEHYHLKTMHNRHILQINHMRKTDFGQYECSAQNSLSTTSVTIGVAGTPKSPTFISAPHGSHATKYMLEWEVESHSPIIEYSIRYKKKSEANDWNTFKVKSNEEKEEKHVKKTQTYELTDLEPGVTYEAVVSAQNKFGWSKESDTFDFRTKHEVSTTTMTKEPTMAAPIVDGGKMQHDDGNNDGSYCHASFLAIVVLCILRPILL